MCKFAGDLIRIKELSLMCDERLRVMGLLMTGRIRADVKTEKKWKSRSEYVGPVLESMR